MGRHSNKAILRNAASSGMYAKHSTPAIVVASLAKDWGDFFDLAVFGEFTEDSTRESLGRFHWDVIGKVHFLDLLFTSTGGAPAFFLQMAPDELIEFIQERIDMQKLFEGTVKRHAKQMIGDRIAA